MATDSKKRPGRGFASTARGAAISRFIKRHFDVRTINSSASRGDLGVRVSQEPHGDRVYVHVFLDSEEESAEWAGEIADKLTQSGYEVLARSGGSFTVSKQEWRLDDAILAGMFAIRPEIMESDSGLVTALPGQVAQLREHGWIKPDTLELTDLGQQVRARLLEQKRTREQANRRRLRERGW